MPPVIINLRRTSTGYKAVSDKEKLANDLNTTNPL